VIIRCPTCKGTRWKHGTAPHSACVGGITFKAVLCAQTCRTCEERVVVLTELGRFEMQVAMVLADEGARTGDAVRAMRRAIGLRPSTFAKLVGAPSAQIEQWERSSRLAPPTLVAVLGAMVGDYASRSSTTVNRLRTLRNGPQRKVVELDLRSRPWPRATRAPRPPRLESPPRFGHTTSPETIKRIEAQWADVQKFTRAEMRRSKSLLPIAAGKASSTTVKKFPAWRDAVIPPPTEEARILRAHRKVKAVGGFEDVFR
jgi:hypothetical protein